MGTTFLHCGGRFEQILTYSSYRVSYVCHTCNATYQAFCLVSRAQHVCAHSTSLQAEAQDLSSAALGAGEDRSSMICPLQLATQLKRNQPIAGVCLQVE